MRVRGGADLFHSVLGDDDIRDVAEASEQETKGLLVDDLADLLQGQYASVTNKAERAYLMGDEGDMHGGRVEGRRGGLLDGLGHRAVRATLSFVHPGDQVSTSSSRGERGVLEGSSA